MRSTERSAAIMEQAQTLLPGGVSSPVRAFAAVGGVPPVIVRGEGAFVEDEDGNRYCDAVLAYGPHILGHRHPAVVAALRDQLQDGTAFGATTRIELRLAELIQAAMPSLELLRFVNSGTEATMSAIRLARAATGRHRIIKCAGGYHGHADALLADAGSGVATLGIPGSPGVPPGAVADTVVVPYNDIRAVEEVLGGDPAGIAAVILEPVAGNMGCVPPEPGYLASLRWLTSAHGTLLIFDEVMTGFRVAHGGAQALAGVRPDLTCLGKVIGGGLPVGAFGGRRDVMELMAPRGPVYQAGTLSGNPLAMAAGVAVLSEIARDPAAVYDHLDALGARLEQGFVGAAQAADCRCTVNRVGSMITPFLVDGPVTDFATARQANLLAFASIHGTWIDGGVLWPPSQYETGFLSTAHTDADADRIADLFAGAVGKLVTAAT